MLKFSELRTRVDCYFSPAERDKLQANASLAGLGLSSFIREAALGNVIKVLPTVNAERWGELARTTANLNQLVHRINEGSLHGVDAALLIGLLEEVQALRRELIGASR
jgi:hypothetical protein